MFWGCMCSRTYRLFRCYQQEAHPFSPIIPDIEHFELELCAYLEHRALVKRQSHDQNHDTGQPTAHKSVSWVGSLFAVLASGAQYADISFKERQTKSHLYGKDNAPTLNLRIANFADLARYSFQCLRMANFLLRPSLLCIQTLLILGNVLQNDMKPEAAWIMLGTTARMAQSLGLHEETDTSSPRRRLWCV
jgi:hypothetical protein